MSLVGPKEAEAQAGSDWSDARSGYGGRHGHQTDGCSDPDLPPFLPRVLVNHSDVTLLEAAVHSSVKRG